MNLPLHLLLLLLQHKIIIIELNCIFYNNQIVSIILYYEFTFTLTIITFTTQNNCHIIKLYFFYNNQRVSIILYYEFTFTLTIITFTTQNNYHIIKLNFFYNNQMVSIIY